MRRESTRLTARVVSILMILGTRLVAGQGARTDDVAQIKNLMSQLSDRSAKPVEVLDRGLSPSDRDKALKVLADPNYELTVVPIEGINGINGDTASLPVRVHFKTESTEEEISSTAQFVKRKGVWYFSSFNFVEVPNWFTVGMVFCFLMGVAYAALVLILRARLARRGQLVGLNWARIFIPFFWPSLFRADR